MACELEISKLGLNEGEVNALKEQLSHKTEALSKVRALDAKIAELEKGERAPELRKARAEYNKVVNDVHDETHSELQRIAKHMAYDKLSTVKRKLFADRVHRNPKILEEMLTNKSMATQHSIYGKFHEEKTNFNALVKGYIEKDGVTENLFKKGNDLNDLSNPHVKGYIGHLRTFMNDESLRQSGNPYFKDDLEHALNLNADTIALDRMKFVRDLKLFADTDKLEASLNEQLKAKSTTEQLIDEGTIGAAKIAHQTQDLDTMLLKWVEQTDLNHTPDISLNKVPFKSDADFSELNKRYCDDDAAVSYTKFAGGRFLKQKVSFDTFGGRLNLEGLPTEAFTHGKFSKKNALDLYDHFMGGSEQTSTKVANMLGWLNKFKTLTVASKFITLPLYTVMDVGVGATLELEKNGELAGKSWTNIIGSRFADIPRQVTLGAQVLGELTKGSINALKKNQSHELHQAYDFFTNLREYEGVRLLDSLGHKHNNKFFDALEKFNHKAIYNVMHNQDQRLRDSTWSTETQLLKRYDPSSPVKLTQRLESVGINDDDLKVIKKYLADNPTHRAIEIGDFESADLRRKLRLLRYNTDMSAVVNDVTPLRLGSIENPVIRNLASFFWSYHLKATSQFFDVLSRSEGLGNKAKFLLSYSLGQMPVNLVINSLFTYLYTGQNPFNAQNRYQTIFGSMLGQVSRPAMVAYAMTFGDKTDTGYQLSNPLLSTMSSFGSVVKQTGEVVGKRVTDDDQLNIEKPIHNLLKTMIGLIPGVGGIGKPLYSNLTRNN